MALSCKNCRWYEAVGQPVDPRTGAVMLAGLSKSAPEVGICRRYPPSVVGPSQASFAITRSIDYCGEFMKAEDGPQANKSELPEC